jgi:hypothetical protein
MARVPTTAKRDARDGGQYVTWRAVATGLLLMPPNAYFAMQRGLEWSGPPGTISLLYNVVFVLLVLTSLNRLLKRFAPRAAYTQAEFITIYAMLCIATTLAGHDMTQVLAPVLAVGHRYATPANDWQALFGDRLPHWLIVRDDGALRNLFDGQSDPYDPANFTPWLRPVFWWSVLLVLIVFTTMCMCAVVRRQWTEHEKLAYPIVEMPYEMTVDGGSRRFFADRLLWCGFALGAGVDLMNGIHHFIPSIPLIPIRTINLGVLFTEKPWSGMGWTPLCFFPFIVGLGFLMPVDLSMSIWVFYLVWKLERVVSSAMGWERFIDTSYSSTQPVGAFITLLAFTLFTSRRHLAKVVRAAFGASRDRASDDADEPVSYRFAFWGGVAGYAGIVLFWVKAGGSPGIMALVFAVYLAFILWGTRIRAEVGPPALTLYRPTFFVVDILGTGGVGKDNLKLFTLVQGVMRAYRSHPMPHMLETMKLSRRAGMSREGRLVAVMLGAAVVGAPMAFWAYLDICYRRGTSGGFGREAYSIAQGWLYRIDASPDIPNIAMMAGASVFTMALMFMRTRFLWWKLHPLGYSMAMNWTTEWAWFPILLGWSAKAVILNHGGIRGYRRASFFFYGLILGDFTMGALLNIVGLFYGQRIYVFWH